MDKSRALRIASDYVNHLIAKKNIEVKGAYLFGSYAKGTQTEFSDIDIAVIIPNSCDTFDMQVQLMLLARGFSLDIEPHPIQADDFSPSNPMAYEIMKTGIALSGLA